MVIAGLIFGIGTGIAVVYQDEIEALSIRALNKRLNKPVDVADVNFSLFEKFPWASIHFKNVTAYGNQEKSDVLIQAESMFLQFSILDLSAESYSIKKIQFKNGQVKLRIDKNGDHNMHFWKSEEDDDEEVDDLSLDLENVLLSNMELDYTSHAKDVSVNALIKFLQLRGKFNASSFGVDVDADILFHKAPEGLKKLTENSSVKYKGSLQVDMDKNSYSFQRNVLNLGRFEFQTSGSVLSSNNQLDLDISLQTEKFKLADLVRILPEQYSEEIKKYKAKGEITFDGKIKGVLSGKSNPSVNMDYTIKNGSIEHSKSGIKMKNLQFSGSYSNGKMRNSKDSRIVIDSLQAELGEGNLTGSVEIWDLTNPQLKIYTNSNLVIQEVIEFYDIDSIAHASGNVDFKLSISGPLNELTDSAASMTHTRLKGDVSFRDVNLKLTGNSDTLKNLSADLVFNKQDVLTKDLKVDLAGSSFLFNGRIQNLLPFLSGKSKNFTVNANVHCPNFHLDQFMGVSEEEGNEGYKGFGFPSFAQMYLHLKVDTFQFKKFHASNITSQIYYGPGMLKSTNTQFAAMNGRVAGDLIIELTNNNHLKFSGKSQLNDIDVYMLFHQFNNFGQSAIKGENLRGIADANGLFSVEWDDKLDMVNEKIKITAEIAIRQGELINYEPMQALSKHIAVEELEHIKFERLTNSIEITDETVYIPEMEINSSALDLKLSGQHAFTNEIEYHFQLWLNDFIFKRSKKRREKQNEFGYVVEDEKERQKLYIKMVGTVDDPKFRLDRKALRKKWGENLNKKQVELKTALNQELGLYKNDSSIHHDPEPVKEYDFQMEWDEFESDSTLESNEAEDTPKETPKVKPPEEKKKKKKKFGQFLDKVTQENEEEYEEYNEDDY